MVEQKIEWKTSLIKSLIYRGITLLLGTLTTYFVTGSWALALLAAPLTEVVQGVNYFIYELIWSNISRRRLEKKIIQRIKNREINIKIDYSSILDFAYQLSQIDTFVPKLYLSTLNIFKKMLQNEELKEIYEQIEKYKENFIRVHSGRKLYFLEEQK